MTEQNTSADVSSTPVSSASEAPASAPASEVEKDILAIYQRLQNLEAHFVEQVGPKLEALEGGFEALLARAKSEAPAAIVAEVEELKTIVHSLGGGLYGLPGHDTASKFHTWWKKLVEPASQGNPVPPSGK